MNFEIEEVKEGAKLENNIFNIPSMPPLSMRGKTQQQNGGRMQMLSSVRPSIPVSQFEQIKPMTQNKARRAISPNLFEPETKQLSSVSTRSKGHTHFLNIQKSPSAQNEASNSKIQRNQNNIKFNSNLNKIVEDCEHIAETESYQVLMKEIEDKINLEHFRDKRRELITQLVQKFEDSETTMLAKLVDELLMVKTSEDNDTKKTVKEYKKILDVNRVIAKYERNCLRSKLCNPAKNKNE